MADPAHRASLAQLQPFATSLAFFDHARADAGAPVLDNVCMRRWSFGNAGFSLRQRERPGRAC